MNLASQKWDAKYGRKVEYHEIVDGEFIPKNRPCDWCAQNVPLGWIHPECAQKEREKLIDILY